MPDPLSFIPGALGAISGIIKGIKGIHQNNLANKVVVPDATYASSPYAAAMLASATQLKNSRMAGAASAEQNIDANQSNSIDSVDRNATSGAQALAMLGAIQGQSNSAFNNLRLQEGADEQYKNNNWNMANQQMIGEGDKEYADRIRKQNMAIQEKNSLRGAANQNIGGGINDLMNGVMASNNAGAFNSNSSNTLDASSMPRSDYNPTTMPYRN